MSEAFETRHVADATGRGQGVTHPITGIRISRLLTGLYEYWQGTPHGPLTQEQEAGFAETEAKIRALPDGESLAIERLAGRAIGRVRFRRLGSGLFLDSEARGCRRVV